MRLSTLVMAVVVLFSAPAFAKGHKSSGGGHTKSHGGHYSGGKGGSSHKGGKYKSASTNDHYRKHK